MPMYASIRKNKIHTIRHFAAHSKCVVYRTVIGSSSLKHTCFEYLSKCYFFFFLVVVIYKYINKLKILIDIDFLIDSLGVCVVVDHCGQFVWFDRCCCDSMHGKAILSSYFAIFCSFSHWNIGR